MKKWVFPLSILALGLLQVTVFDSFAAFNVKPDLLLVSAIGSAFFLEAKSALLLSIVAGILKDIFGLNRIAINTILFPLWVLLVVRLSRRISIDNNFVRVFLIFIITIFNIVGNRVVFYFLHYFISWGVFMRILLLESLYTALISSLVFKITEPLFIAKT